MRLETFFKAYDCPGPFHVQEYLQAADSHELDYRLLPAISLVESTCGAFERMNNRWGWDSTQSGFESVPAGIDYITEQLAENPKYKGKSVKEKLFTYNPFPQYVRQVERLDAPDRGLGPQLPVGCLNSLKKLGWLRCLSATTLKDATGRTEEIEPRLKCAKLKLCGLGTVWTPGRESIYPSGRGSTT